MTKQFMDESDIARGRTWPYISCHPVHGEYPVIVIKSADDQAKYIGESLDTIYDAFIDLMGKLGVV